jgi:hypothetical protein
LPALVATFAFLVQFLYTRLGGFYLDDFRDLGQAKAGLSLHLLMTPIGITRIQPGGRFIEWLVAVPFRDNYQAACAMTALFVGAGTYWLIRLLDRLFGKRHLHLALGLLFGTSWIFISTDQWFAAAGATISVMLTVAGCHAYFTWLRGASVKWYSLGLLASTAGVLFWEQVLVLPAWLLLMWLVFAPGVERPVHQVIASISAFAATPLMLVVYVQSQAWHQRLVVPALGTYLRLMVVMIFHGLLPTLVGGGLPNGTPNARGWVSIVLPCVVLFLVCLWSAMSREHKPVLLSAGFFIAGAILASVLIAGARVDMIGVQASGNTPRYLDPHTPATSRVVSGGCPWGLYGKSKRKFRDYVVLKRER